MALNFKDLINKELNNGGATTTNNSDTRKQPRIKVTKKVPFFGRVLPLGEDEYPFATYSEAWVDYTKDDGEQTVACVTFDPEEHDDKLAKLLYSVIGFNRDYNEAHQDHKSDIIVLNHRNANYPLRVGYRSEFVGIPMAKDVQTGGWTLKQNPQTGYEFHNYSVSYAAYKSMLELTQDDTMLINGAPFPTDLGYITADKTFPITIKLPANAKAYDVKFSNVELPAITFDYLQRGEDGDFKFFDDPALHNKSTKATNPDFYEKLYNQLSQSATSQKEALTGTQSAPQVESPYTQQQAPSAVAPNPAPAVSPAFAQQQPTQAQPAPQQASVQPTPTPVANIPATNEFPPEPKSTPTPTAQAPVAPSQADTVAPSMAQGVNPSPAQTASKPSNMASLEDIVKDDADFVAPTSNDSGFEDPFKANGEPLSISESDLPF